MFLALVRQNMIYSCKQVNTIPEKIITLLYPSHPLPNGKNSARRVTMIFNCAIIINFLCMPLPPHTPCTCIDVGRREATLIKEFNILSPLKMYQQTYVATNVTL